MNEIHVTKEPYVAWLRAALATDGMTASKFATLIREYVDDHKDLWESVPDDELTDKDRRQRRMWREHLGADGKYLGPGHDAFTKNVRMWVTRGTVPNPRILREAINAVVTKVLEDPPESAGSEWSKKTFWEAMKFADHIATRNVSSRVLARKTESQVTPDDETRNLLRAGGQANQIDPVRELGLGSALFHDALPPYVPRAADRLVTARLMHHETHPIIAIVGPPKSGKSRSVFELLAAMNPNPIVWWHNPAPGNLEPLLKSMDRFDTTDPECPEVVVLDDIGLNGLNSKDGLTEHRLRQISSRATVIAIVHDTDLATWRMHSRGRYITDLDTHIGIGATPALVHLFDVNRVDYAVTLDGDEMIAASAALAKSPSNRTKGLELNRFAEAMATVDELLAAAKHALTVGGIRAALVDAAVDASITDPVGTSLDWLKALTRIRSRHHSPNTRWNSSDFDVAFDTWATVGFSPGSPHAILTRATHGRYRLLDALIPNLRAPKRSLSHLTEHVTAEQAVRIGAYYYTAQVGEAKHWWELASQRGSADAAFSLGIASEDGEAIAGHTATDWYVLAAERGSADAAYNLGCIASENGEAILDHTDTARTATDWYVLAAERGSAEAAYNLGINSKSGDAILDHTGIARTATDWYVLAAERGSAEAAFNLGCSAAESGDAIPDHTGTARTATDWYVLAAERGSAEAAHNLGCIASESGEAIPDHTGTARTATDWHVLAAERGDPVASLAVILKSAKDRPPIAGKVDTVLYLLDAQNGSATAAFNLGYIASKSGDVILDHTGTARTATDWYVLAAERGSAAAAFNLGITSEDGEAIPDHTGTARTATDWYVLAAQRENTSKDASAEAAFSLGCIAFDKGEAIPDHTGTALTATEWWELAASRGSAAGAHNLSLAIANADYQSPTASSPESPYPTTGP